MTYTLIIDKQSRLNPSNEKKSYILNIEELRTNGTVSDELIISPDESYIMRKLSLSEYQVLNVLENPIKEVIENPQIELFEGDNYIYLVDMVGNKFYAEYLIKNNFNDTFITKREAKAQIDMASNYVVISVNEKLQSYSTTEEMNTAINLKAGEIELKAEEMYETKENAEKKYAEIDLATNEIKLEVGKKVNNNEIITQLNLSPEDAKINSNKIELTAIDILNLLAGNEINLGSKSITIKSDNFSVDKNGNVVMHNAQFTGGKIHVEDTGNIEANANIIAESNNYIAEMQSSGFTIENKNTSNADFVWITSNSLVALDENRYGFDFGIGSDGKLIWGIKDANGKLLSAGDTQFVLYSPGQATNLMLSANGAYINGYKIQTNTSDARLKNNIQDSIENALEKIMQIRHRSFEWKENGEQQKNGYIAQELEKIDSEFVINENDKYSINVLNLLATVTKAIQEQQKEIENMKGAK